MIHFGWDLKSPQPVFKLFESVILATRLPPLIHEQYFSIIKKFVMSETSFYCPTHISLPTRWNWVLNVRAATIHTSFCYDIGATSATGKVICAGLYICIFPSVYLFYMYYFQLSNTLNSHFYKLYESPNANYIKSIISGDNELKENPSDMQKLYAEGFTNL